MIRRKVQGLFRDSWVLVVAGAILQAICRAPDYYVDEGKKKRDKNDA